MVDISVALLVWEMWDDHEHPDQGKRLKTAKGGPCTPVQLDQENLVGHFSGKSGNYITTLERCECIDFSRRKQPCKHMYRLAIELGLIEAEVTRNTSDIVSARTDVYSDTDKSDDFRYVKKDRKTLVEMIMRPAIILDTETAGITLNSYASITDKQEVLQLAIVSDSGETIFNQYFKPEFRKSWGKAQDVHGITPESLENEKPLSEYLDRIQGILDSFETVVMYNAEFDTEFLRAAGCKIDDGKVLCAMRESVLLPGASKQSKLLELAVDLGYREFEEHNALGDSLATLHIYNEIKGAVLRK